MKKILFLLSFLTLILTACTSSKDYLDSKTVLKAFSDAELPITDARDNSHNCDSLNCVSIITTEDISIYEWKTEEEALNQKESSFGDSYSLGNIYIRSNNEKIDFDEYKNVLKKLFND